jgi:hypothetical protein
MCNIKTPLIVGRGMSYFLFRDLGSRTDALLDSLYKESEHTRTPRLIVRCSEGRGEPHILLESAYASFCFGCVASPQIVQSLVSCFLLKAPFDSVNRSFDWWSLQMEWCDVYVCLYLCVRPRGLITIAPLPWSGGPVEHWTFHRINLEKYVLGIQRAFEYSKYIDSIPLHKNVLI